MDITVAAGGGPGERADRRTRNRGREKPFGSGIMTPLAETHRQPQGPAVPAHAPRVSHIDAREQTG